MVADAVTVGTPSLTIMEVPKARAEGRPDSAVSFPAEGAIWSTDAQMGNMFVTKVGRGIFIGDERSFGARMPNDTPELHIELPKEQPSHMLLIVSFMSTQPYI